MSHDPLEQTGIMTQPPLESDPSWCAPLAELCAADANTPAVKSGGVNAAHSTSGFPDLGPRYRITKKLGQGGMGAVYLSDDLNTNSRVAIKVLPLESVPDQTAVQRFQKEARLLSEVRHPHVANLIDFGKHGTTCFLVMELVEGTDLKGLLQKHGPLPERLALQIVYEIAAALSAAHCQGIVHRDLKPANVLLSALVTGTESPAEAVFAAVAAGQAPTVKLTDFGLARHVDQAASMDLTKTGAMLGTPYYISPEQCTDKGKVTPAADVYSLGATLFELLTGRPPFKADDPIKLITMHCFEQAPDPRKLNPEISDGVATLIAKSLQKSPTARYADAEHLLQELDRLLRGDATSVAIHPVTPTARGKIFEATWEWNLDSSPAQLWPLVSNTERINAAVGLPSVEYVTRRDEQGTKHRFGSFRLGWTRLSWEEHPFEWVEGRRLGVLREFENGPFQWFLNTVELTPRTEGGTHLTHTVRIATKGWLGQLLAHIEVNLKGRKPLDKVYRRIDEVVSGRLGQSATLDPFVPTATSVTSVHKKLGSYRDRLLQQGIAPQILEQLLEFLADSPPQELARIRPRALARRLQIDADQLTAACLAACHVGLLEMHWDVLCPTCRVSSSVRDTLSEIDRHAQCEACDTKFDVDFSRSVELIFRVHPEFRLADLKTYCIGGPEHAPHVVAQTRVEPGENLELDLSLDPGSYMLRGGQLPYTLGIVVEPTIGAGRLVIELDSQQQSRRPYRVHAGRQLITLENRFPQPLVLRMERTVMRSDAVTAADAMRLPQFRKLFPSEIITRERLSNLSTSTLVALRIQNVLDLCNSLGDADTFGKVGATLAACRSLIEVNGGKLVKEQDDGLLAAFPLAIDAIRVSLELKDAHTAVGIDDAPRLQIAVHRGMTMSTSFNGRQDYFGRSVALTNRLLDTSLTNSLIISAELAADDDVVTFFQTTGRALRQNSDSGDFSTFEVFDQPAAAPGGVELPRTEPRAAQGSLP